MKKTILLTILLLGFSGTALASFSGSDSSESWDSSSESWDSSSESWDSSSESWNGTSESWTSDDDDEDSNVFLKKDNEDAAPEVANTNDAPSVSGGAFGSSSNGSSSNDDDTSTTNGSSDNGSSDNTFNGSSDNGSSDNTFNGSSDNGTSDNGSSDDTGFSSDNTFNGGSSNGAAPVELTRSEQSVIINQANALKAERAWNSDAVVPMELDEYYGDFKALLPLGDGGVAQKVSLDAVITNIHDSIEAYHILLSPQHL